MRIRRIFKTACTFLAAVLLFVLCTGFTFARHTSFSPADLPHTFSQVYRGNQTGRGFTWCTGTDFPVGKAYLVEGHISDADWNGAQELEVTSRFLQGYERGSRISDDGYTATYEKKYIENQKVYVHKAAAENLTAGKTYSYKCTAEGVADGDAIVGEFTVRTDDDYFTEGLSFVHVTDTQQGSLSEYEHNYYTAMKDVYKSMSPDFVLHTGDITDNNWDGIARIIQYHWAHDSLNEAANAPVIMTSTGNHDMEDSIFNSFYNYDLPEMATGKTGSYCAYTLGNVLFVNVDTNESGFARPNGLSDAQMRFIEDALKNTTADFKIIQTHKGLLSNGKHHLDPEMPYIRDQLMPLLDRYDVDLFLNGHDHIYSRTVPVTWNTNTKRAEPSMSVSFANETSSYFKSEKGTVHITLQPAGTKREILPYAGWVTSDGGRFTSNVVAYLNGIMDVNGVSGKTAHSTTINTPEQNLNMFAYVTVKGDTLRYNVYTLNPDTGETKLYDTFAIRKQVHYAVHDADTQSAAQKVTQQISALPVVIGEQAASTVAQIRAAYDALFDAQKQEVENYARLTDAEAQLEKAKVPSTADTATTGCGAAVGNFGSVWGGATTIVMLIFLLYIRSFYKQGEKK